MSFTATISIAGSPSAARKILRPMRPKPLIPTFTGMVPPGAYSMRTVGTTGRRSSLGNARARGRKCQRGSIVLFHFYDAIAGEGDEHSLRRRSAVNPVLGLLTARPRFPHLVVRAAQRRENHFVVHSFERGVILDRLLELRR